MAGAIKGAIPWTAINDYAARNGMTDPDDFADFLSAIRSLERAEVKIDAARKENRQQRSGIKT